MDMKSEAEIRVEFTTIPALDQDLVTEYLVKLQTRSWKSRRLVSFIIDRFYRVVNKSIVDLTCDDMDKYLKDLDGSTYRGKPMGYKTKKMNKSRLCGYMTFARAKMNRKGYKLLDLMPPTSLFDFAPDPPRTVKSDSGLLSDEEMERLLDCAKHNKLRDYVYLLLLKHTGGRAGEILSARVQNAHVDERYLITGVDNGNRKSNQHGDTPLYVFYPQEVANELAMYMLTLPKDEEFLFATPREFKPIAITYKRKIGIHLRFHSFRYTINTKRRKMGCPMEDREFLLNQKISVNADYYVKLSIAEKRAIYDRWNPYV